MAPHLPDPPDPSRYWKVAVYGFFLERPLGPFFPFWEIADSQTGDYVALFLSPKQLSFDEPLATAITFTQGGGKFVESRGNLVKQASIAGTTGYLPRPRVASVGRQDLVDNSPGADLGPEGRGERSGFAAFYKLRQLFRTFGHERRQGNIIKMHFFDDKGGEYWEIEPQMFSLRRSSSQPMTYNYEIRFTCLEPSASQLTLDIFTSDSYSVTQSAMVDLPGAQYAGMNKNTSGLLQAGWRQQASAVETDAVQTPVSVNALYASVGATTSGTGASSGFAQLLGSIGAKTTPIATTLGRWTSLVANGVNSLKLFAGAVQRSFQEVLTAMGAVVQVVDDVGTTLQTLEALPHGLHEQVEDAITGCFQAWSDLTTPLERSSGANAELNEFLLEVLMLNDQMRASSAQADGSYSSRMASEISNFSTARTSPAATDLFTETGQPLSQNPFVGAAGLELVTDLDALRASDGFRSVVVLWGETIYDVARRTLGNVHRFVELVFVNQLNFPFIVASSQKKPPGTIAWGEHIKIPIQTGSSNQVAVGPPATPLPVLGSVVSTVGTSMEVVDTTKTWRENQWAGYTLTLLSGSGVVDATRLVVSNTSDTLVMNRPWSVRPAVGDQFSVTLQEFSLRIPPTPEQVTFGRDILLAFSRKAGNVPNPYNATLLLNARGDLATVSGEENFIQAMVLMIATPQGFHPFHPRYGVGVPIGRPFTAAVSPLYTYFAQQSLRSDPRVDTVQNIKLGFEGGAVSFRVDVKPVNAHKAKQIDLSL